MKRTYSLSIISTVFAIFLFAACNKDTDKPPVINLTSPVEGSTVAGEVRIQGSVADESLHRLKLKVTLNDDGTEIFSYSKHWHGKKEFSFDERFTPTELSGNTQATLWIEVEDELNQKTTKTVGFTIGS